MNDGAYSLSAARLATRIKSIWPPTTSAVIASRTMKLATGGESAEREARRMVAEKIEAALSLQTLALTGGLGTTPQSAARKSLGHYRRRVRANPRRLAKE